MDDLRGRASERRQLTVLFCDVVDLTGLSERRDPEDLREVLLEFQTICSRCIKDAGGTIVNYIGDGIRAGFGYPLTSENEAESAVRAGLLLLRDIQELSERSMATIQEPLRVRIGVHTGVAIIGKGAQGHVHDATEIVGDTPNIAARLQEIGEPNSLVISGETERLVRGKFPLRPLGMRALKGLSRKIEVFQVVGEAIEEDIAHHRRHHNASPLIGRVAELGQLLQAWELAKAGRGQTVEITGEPGIGKSRLALELIDKTDLPDDSIVALTSLSPASEHTALSYHPLAQANHWLSQGRERRDQFRLSARIPRQNASRRRAAFDDLRAARPADISPADPDRPRCAGASPQDPRHRRATADVARACCRGPDSGRGLSLGRSLHHRGRRAHRWSDRQCANPACDH